MKASDKVSHTQIQTRVQKTNLQCLILKSTTKTIQIHFTTQPKQTSTPQQQQQQQTSTNHRLREDHQPDQDRFHLQGLQLNRPDTLQMVILKQNATYVVIGLRLQEA